MYCLGTHGHHEYRETQRLLVCDECGRDDFVEIPFKVGPGGLPLHEDPRPIARFANHVVEFFSQGHGPRLGIVSNIPPRRVVARVLFVKGDSLRVESSDGAILTVDPSHITNDFGVAEAGWGKLAESITTFAQVVHENREREIAELEAQARAEFGKKGHRK